ncbi:hypothetical protein GCM10011579_054070 [Streptomyces albiflavescens]|uniref:Uncharacterized protein n=1 Tax=Streptomyces albiflavescens TaxID=1623582 RepID=A0A917Y7X0_9ACTN|nr:hypothetical protein GCM10011579_054070 [Streptomyces albiflavescens]
MRLPTGGPTGAPAFARTIVPAFARTIVPAFARTIARAFAVKARSSAVVQPVGPLPRRPYLRSTKVSSDASGGQANRTGV